MLNLLINYTIILLQLHIYINKIKILKIKNIKGQGNLEENK